jgi:hypothetical protein
MNTREVDVARCGGWLSREEHGREVRFQRTAVRRMLIRAIGCAGRS